MTVKALRRFTVRVSLPEELAALNDLVLNLRWSWHAPTREIFESIDPPRWLELGNNPQRLLGAVSPDRLRALAADRSFKRRLAFAVDDLRQYLGDPGWYAHIAEKSGPTAQLPKQIAYFSPEFGITEVLPQYSGGLGILAGDHLKTASDLGVPILGVGLLYGAGYFSQSLSADGWQKESYPSHDPEGMPLVKLRGADGQPVHITIGMLDGQELHAQIWQAMVGRVTLLLLDSDIDLNAPVERSTTDRLYGGGKEHRLAQEILLGVGGVRAIRAYCALTGAPDPEVFHTNEGHAGFLGLERIRELLTADDNALSFEEALCAVRAGTVFTTHTPVPAGIDRFEQTLLSPYLEQGRVMPGLPVDRVLALGAEDDPAMFNMAHMGLRLAQHANGVSKLHGAVSRGMFNGLWSGFDEAEVPISSVTNGVHAPTWVAPAVQELAAKESGSDDVAAFSVADSIPAKPIWSLRNKLRAELVTEIRRRVYKSSLQRGTSAAELGWTESIFDRHVLTIGFARRVPSYKRLTLMLRDPDRLKSFLLHPDRPVQIVIAGKSHPADDGGKALIQQMVRFTDDPEVRHRIAFLPDYDIEMARSLYAGCDVWLNNPLRPLEACGTSGMKSALNGGLNLSIRDGWWDEMADGGNGWSIPTADGVDADRRDDIEAGALYDLIEHEVAARFYDVDKDRVPQRWVEMVRHTLTTLGPKVVATRMVNDYVHHLYAPAAQASAALTADGFRGARGLSAWIERVRAAWSGVHVVYVDSSSTDDAPAVGSAFELRTEVALAGLSPDDVVVQAVFGRPDDDNELREATHLDMTLTSSEEGRHTYVAETALDRPGATGYTVRVLPRHAALASPVELGLIATA